MKLTRAFGIGREILRMGRSRAAAKKPMNHTSWQVLTFSVRKGPFGCFVCCWFLFLEGLRHPGVEHCRNPSCPRENTSQPGCLACPAAVLHVLLFLYQLLATPPGTCLEPQHPRVFVDQVGIDANPHRRTCPGALPQTDLDA